MANIKKSFNFRSGVQVDDDHLIVDTNGAVGIGSTVPTELLDVNGNIKTSGNVTGTIGSFTKVIATDLDITNVNIQTGNVSGSGVKIGDPVGVITAQNVGETVTYYGDGQYLENIPTSQWIDKDVGLGFVSIYAAGNVGVGTEDPRHTFQIGGNNNPNDFEEGVGINSRGGVVATGVVTATTFKGNLTGDITSAESNITQVESTYVNNSGIVTTTDLHVTGITTTPKIEGLNIISQPHGPTETIIVTVAPKTSNNRYYNEGNSNAYYLDGKEAPFLTLVPGRTYRFDQSDPTNTAYPLRFYYDSLNDSVYGGGLNVVGAQGTAGAYVDITITESSPQVIYYDSASAATLLGNVIKTNSAAQVHNLQVVGVLTATNSIVGSLTGDVTSTKSTFDQVDTLHINTTGIGTFSELLATQSFTGITTSELAHVQNGLGIGINNPKRIVDIYSSGIATVDVVGRESAMIQIGQNYTVTAGIGQSVGIIRFGTQDKTFELINGDSGDFNSYIHSGNFVGVNTGNFNWIYGQTNQKLMSLTYDGKLGINKPDPEVQLDVVGVSTFTGSVLITGNLEVDGDLIGGNTTLPPLITGSDIFRQTGISTFVDVDITNIVEVGAIAIGTSREDIIEAGAIDAQFSRAFVSALGIGTNVTPSTLTVDGAIGATGSVGIGTTIATSGADFARAGVPITRFLKLPRVTSNERDNLVALEGGSVIWNTDESRIEYYNESGGNWSYINGTGV